ncbi:MULTISPECIES: hypothetical protein [Streptomyces]|uniref:Uncharacterized protein n=1 Tax=Streptomyces flavochromogenes TaxID=68199 RepID=A0ABW6Y3N4_9ACTN
MTNTTAGRFAAWRAWRAWRARRREARELNRAAELLAYGKADVLRAAADWAITEARQAAAPGEPGRVTVDDVLSIAVLRVGAVLVERQEAAEALRQRYEHQGGARDLTTDAYDGQHHHEGDQR